MRPCQQQQLDPEAVRKLAKYATWCKQDPQRLTKAIRILADKTLSPELKAQWEKELLEEYAAACAACNEPSPSI